MDHTTVDIRRFAVRTLETVLDAQPTELRDAYYGRSFLSSAQNVPPVIDAAQLATITQPTALLLGTADNFASQDIGRAIAAALPEGRLFPIEGAGHLPWLEKAEERVELLSAFLKR